MYTSKYAKGTVPIGDFMRYEKGAETFYECLGGNASRTMTFIQSHVSRAKCKTKMQKMLLIDSKSLITVPIIKVTILVPAEARRKCGVKKGSIRNYKKAPD